MEKCRDFKQFISLLLELNERGVYFWKYRLESAALFFFGISAVAEMFSAIGLIPFLD